MNTLVENNGRITRVRLSASNPVEKLALATLGENSVRGQALVMRQDGGDWLLQLADLIEEKKAANVA